MGGGERTELSAKPETLGPAPSTSIGSCSEEVCLPRYLLPRIGFSGCSSSTVPPRAREDRLAAPASGRALLDSSRSPKQKTSAPEWARTWRGSAPAQAAGPGDPSLLPYPPSPARTPCPPPPHPHPGRARPQPGAHTRTHAPAHTPALPRPPPSPVAEPRHACLASPPAAPAAPTAPGPRWTE